jgi:(2,2,3-trimethyl-5-oxocyclopent-3-enyl)acetyl-CoA 1,5-monooxygenase
MHLTDVDFDVVVVGGGLTGMYQLYRLRELGLKVCGIEKNGDVGGTWNMNRYPGCRLDSESYTYAYSFLKDLLDEWNWTEEFAAQPALNEFFSRAADRMDIRRSFRFNTQMTQAVYDETDGIWEVHLGNAEVLRSRFLVSCMGILSNPIVPKFKGADLFRGRSLHSYYWPHAASGFGGQKYDFAGKRVGVIGTGATGIQIITEVAKTAGELTVFQRHPNWCAPLGNKPISEQRMSSIREDYDRIFEQCRSTMAGFKHDFSYASAKDFTRDEQLAILEERYNEPGFGKWVGHFADLFSDADTNRLVTEFMAAKIRGRVKSPEIAAKLIPQDHGFGLKRVPLESGYYEVYNQENVRLVDIHEDPIIELSPTGVVTKSGLHELDVIIYATGFHAIIGAFQEITIKGRHGTTLREAWRDGPNTYLGLQVPNFPNFFTILAVHNGATFCNVPRCAETQVQWVTEFFAYMKEHDVATVEADVGYADAWTQHCYDVVKDSLFPTYTNSYFWGQFDASKDAAKRFLFYFGGNPAYRQRCAEVKANGYEGFILSERSSTLGSMAEAAAA